MNKLSKREKGMLVMLGIIMGCGILFMFVIKPIMDTAALNKATIAELEVKVMESKAAIIQRPVIEKRLNDAIDFVNENGKVFYNKMKLWDAERHVKKILYDNDIEYHSISITGPVNFQKPPTDPKAVVDPKATIESNGIEETTMVVECHTTKAKFTSVLDAFYNHDKKISLSSWEYAIDAKTPEIKALITVKLYAIQ